MQSQERSPRHVSARAVTTMLLLGGIVAVLFVVINNVFSIKFIEVVGNNAIDDAAIIELSGVQTGGSMFSVDTRAIADAINGNVYLEYIDTIKSYPNRVILSVWEDMPRAQVEWMGTLILLGKGGAVLERKTKMDHLAGVPVVTVLVDENAMIQLGKPLETAKGQIDAVSRILEECVAQDVIHEVSELNAKALDNIYLETLDDVHVTLGTTEALADKIAYMRAVLLELRESGTPVSGGVLDVTTGKYADFLAPGQ